MTARRTVGFGCPNAPDPHHFVVELPSGRNGTVTITEHYGARAYIEAPVEVELRCLLSRHAWLQVADGRAASLQRAAQGEAASSGTLDEWTQQGRAFAGT